MSVTTWGGGAHKKPVIDSAKTIFAYNPFTFADAVAMVSGFNRSILDTGDLEIFADPFFEKVFVNIFDYSLLHGEKLTEIRVTSHERKNGGTLLITDNGIGVPRP